MSPCAEMRAPPFFLPAVLALSRHPSAGLSASSYSFARVRPAEAAELANERGDIFDRVASLVAQGTCADMPEASVAALKAATREDLVRCFCGASRRDPGAVGRSAILLAEADGALVGACGVQVLPLTVDGRGEALMRRMSRDERRSLELRPLLSNLVVSAAHRRQGIGSQLVSRAEALAQQWGFDELLLRVDVENAAARALYAERGYATEACGLDAERCELSPWRAALGLRALTWARCEQAAMRKSPLRRGGSQRAVLATDVARLRARGRDSNPRC